MGIRPFFFFDFPERGKDHLCPCGSEKEIELANDEKHGWTKEIRYLNFEGEAAYARIINFYLNDPKWAGNLRGIKKGHFWENVGLGIGNGVVDFEQYLHYPKIQG